MGAGLVVLNHMEINMEIGKVTQKVCQKRLVSFFNTSQFNLHPMWSEFRATYATETDKCVFPEKVRAAVDKSCWCSVLRPALSPRHGQP